MKHPFRAFLCACFSLFGLAACGEEPKIELPAGCKEDQLRACILKLAPLPEAAAIADPLLRGLALAGYAALETDPNPDEAERQFAAAKASIDQLPKRSQKWELMRSLSFAHASTGAFENARRIYEFPPSDENYIRALTELALSERLLGSEEAATNRLIEARNAAEAARGYDVYSWLLIEIAATQWLMEDRQGALKSLDAALAATSSMKDSLVQILAWSEIARRRALYGNAQNADAILDGVKKAIAILASPVERVLATAALAKAEDALSRTSDAALHFREAKKLSEILDDPLFKGMILEGLSAMLAGGGEIEDGKKLFDEGYRIAALTMTPEDKERIENGLNTSWANAAYEHALLGNPKLAVAVAEVIKDPALQSWAYHRIAVLFHLTGEASRTQESLRRAIASAAAVEDKDARLSALLQIAPSLLLTGTP